MMKKQQLNGFDLWDVSRKSQRWCLYILPRSKNKGNHILFQLFKAGQNA